MKRTFFGGFLCLLMSQAGAGQDKPTVNVLQGRNQILIKIDVSSPLSDDFVHKYAGDINSYYLYEVKDPDDLRKQIAAEVAEINTLQNEKDVRARLASLIDRLKQLPTNLVRPDSVVGNPADGQRITLQLTQQIDYSKSYVLKIKGLDLSTKPTAGAISAPPQLNPPSQQTATEVPVTTVSFQYPKDPTADLQPSIDVYNQKEVRVISSGPIQTAASISVQQRTLRISPDLTGVVEHLKPIAAKVTGAGDNEVTLELQDKLRGGTAYNLLIPAGLSDGSKPIKVNGAIKFPGGPGAPDTPKIDLSVSSVAAVHQKGVFDFTLKAVPVKPRRIGTSEWYREPKIEADIGLRSTKSANSIKFLYLFRRNLFTWPAEGKVDGNDYLHISRDQKVKTSIPVFANWATTPWLAPSSLKFWVGPKLETDRTFHRFNTLGNARFDLYFHRWKGSIADRRDMLKSDLQAQQNVKKENKNDFNLIEIYRGLKLIPSLSFDFGGHINNETVTNTKKKVSLTVPRHGIFRITPGFTGVFEWRTFMIPTTLTLDESVIYMATPEQIGFTTDTGVGLRRIRGWQPHFSTSFDFALDPGKHYSFNITYENGRAAPNFEYLNKLTTGIKVKFGSADQAASTK